MAVVSPDPDLNSGAQEFFTRHVRVIEKVMEVWTMPELRRQVYAFRETFSADVRKPFVLEPSLLCGGQHLPDQSSPSNSAPGHRPELDRTDTMGQHLDAPSAHSVGDYAPPYSHPDSATAMGNQSDSLPGQLLVMAPGGPAPSLPQSHPMWGYLSISESMLAVACPCGECLRRNRNLAAQSYLAPSAPPYLFPLGVEDAASLQGYPNPNNQVGNGSHISSQPYTTDSMQCRWP